LEVRTADASRKIQIRFGYLRRLPAEYVGERHTVVAKELPSQNGQEWVEFEEVPGPDPNPPQQPARRSSVPTHFDVMFVAPYPRPEQMP
jgi:hypothetical protein